MPANTFPTFPAKYARQWVQSERANDPIWKNNVSIKAFEKTYGRLQPFDHCPDHLFPNAAAKFGLTRFVPAKKEELVTGAKGPKCAVGGKTADCHSASIPSFLYLSPYDCASCTKFGEKTLIHNYAPKVTEISATSNKLTEMILRMCWGCTTKGRSGCTLVKKRLGEEPHDGSDFEEDDRRSLESEEGLSVIEEQSEPVEETEKKGDSSQTETREQIRDKKRKANDEQGTPTKNPRFELSPDTPRTDPRKVGPTWATESSAKPSSPIPSSPLGPAPPVQIGAKARARIEAMRAKRGASSSSALSPAPSVHQSSSPDRNVDSSTPRQTNQLLPSLATQINTNALFNRDTGFIHSALKRPSQLGSVAESTESNPFSRPNEASPLNSSPEAQLGALLQEYTGAISSIPAKWESVSKGLREVMSEMGRRRQMAIAQSERDRSAINSVRQERDTAQHNMNVLDTQLAKKSTELQNMTAELKQSHAKVAALNEQLRDVQQTAITFEGRMNSAVSARESANAALRDAEATSQKALADAKSADSALEDSFGQNEILEKEVQNLQAALALANQGIRVMHQPADVSGFAGLQNSAGVVQVGDGQAQPGGQGPGGADSSVSQ